MTPLWPHQQHTLDELSRLIDEGEREICITIPTGGGKTRVMFEDILAAGCPVQVNTDRRMLLSQLAKGLDSNGIDFGYRASGYEPALLRGIQLSMVQTEVSRVLKGDRDIHRAKRVYWDEAHKNAGDTTLRLRKRHREEEPEYVDIGLTATPLGLGHCYSSLIVGGTNSELRNCGALVPAYHYGPDEPDTKWIGKIAVNGGECGLPQNRRMDYCHRVFGSVVEHYLEHNPQQRPTIGFAPDVEGGIWFSEECSHEGIPSAFISGEKIWYGGELLKNTEELRDQIAEEHRDGKIKIVWNRFVLREGIDWPWVYHGIFATVFGSLTSYIQAGGRLLRACGGKNECVITDHGGNWHRHGSLNTDREWHLSDDDRTVSGVREDRMREKQEPEPIRCPKCDAIRLSGPKCFQCGYEHTTRSRMVFQANGSLREMKGDIYRRRRRMEYSERIQKEWAGRIKRIANSKKEHVRRMTCAQLEVAIARDHNWQYPPRGLEMMPMEGPDWFRPICDLGFGAVKREAVMDAAESEGW